MRNLFKFFKSIFLTMILIAPLRNRFCNFNKKNTKIKISITKPSKENTKYEISVSEYFLNFAFGTRTIDIQHGIRNIFNKNKTKNELYSLLCSILVLLLAAYLLCHKMLLYPSTGQRFFSLVILI